MNQSPSQKYASKRNFLLGRLWLVHNSIRTATTAYDSDMYLSSEDKLALSKALLLIKSVVGKWDSHYVKKKMEDIECEKIS